MRGNAFSRRPRVWDFLRLRRQTSLRKGASPECHRKMARYLSRGVRAWRESMLEDLIWLT
jgi:hypothetical protein